MQKGLIFEAVALSKFSVSENHSTTQISEPKDHHAKDVPHSEILLTEVFPRVDVRVPVPFCSDDGVRIRKFSFENRLFVW